MTSNPSDALLTECNRCRRRRENLQARVQAKKQNKITKREKKLMRPGFEGRRDTFINGGS